MRLLSLKSILAAVDLDDASIPALRTASRLAQLAGARLHLLHVRAVPDLGGEPRLARHFQEVTGDTRSPDSVEEIVGIPAAVIVQQALKVNADAIILGPHRKRDTNEMGSTAAGVVSTASCPCLVLATELHLPLQTVVAAVDISDATGGSLSVALAWASALRPRSQKAALTVSHVTDSATASTRERLNEEVQSARARAGGADFVDVREVILRGADPAEQILEALASETPDLVVVGTRATTRRTSAMGSVSTAITRAAPCPLLLVPPVTWQDQE